MIKQFDYNIIENLLSLLDDSPKDNKDISRPKQICRSSALSDETAMHTAYCLKEFADQMPGGFFIYHADGNEELIYANNAMLRILNCDSMKELRTLTGNSFRGIVHPDDIEAVEESIQEQLAKSQYDLDYVEYRIIQKGGDIRWIEDYGHFIHSEKAGDIFYVFAADATEKKQRQLEEKEYLLLKNLQTEQLLQNQIEEHNKELEKIHQEHLRRLETIAGLSIDYESIFYVDLDSNQIKAYRVSPRIEKQFSSGNTTQAFTGFDSDYIRDWVYPDDRELLTGVSTPEYIREKLSANNTFHINYRVLKNQKPFYIQLHIVNVGSREHISQIILGYRNIDDDFLQQMKQKQILEEALNEANAANNAKNLFLSNMSHDIRTPMNAIISFTHLAKQHINNREKVSNYLDMISNSSEQLLQLLNDVLEISRIESGKIKMEKIECHLLDVVHDIQMAMLPKAETKNITLSLDVSGLKNDIVYADQQKLSMILSYLVDNAIKYTEPNGWITIMSKEEENPQGYDTFYKFMIEDNGIGISEDFIKHIFDPFEREKNTTLSGIYGTGLGLTITKKLVNMMGGTIHIASTVGKGSKFTVAFPFRKLDQTHTHVQKSGSTFTHLPGTKKILIVDDNEINLLIEEELLKAAGFLIDTATDGSIAVEKVKQSNPGDYDLILMDIQMPIMNGYHATRVIRELEEPALASIPIIAVSANTFEEDKRAAIESGMNAHLAKPLDTPLLYKLIHKYLRKAEERDSIES